MANITQQDLIRYQIDTLDLGVTGTAIYSGDSSINLLNADEVTGIDLDTVGGASAEIYFAFNTGGYWFSLSSQGYAQDFSTDTPDFSALKANGNTPADLRELESIPAFAGKSLSIAVGMSANINEELPPALSSFKVKYRSSETVLAYEEYSPVYYLGNDGIILSASSSVTEEGTGKINLKGRITTPEGEMSDWQDISQLKETPALSVQFKAKYSVETPGSGTAKINEVTVLTADASKSGAYGDKTLITNTENWYIAIRQGRLMLKHDPLDEGSTITPYLALRKLPESIDSQILGTGTGERAQYELPQKTGIDIHSIKLFIDGSRVYTGYEVNTATGKLTCTAPSGTMITVSYEYGIEPETWQEMQEVSSWEMPEYTQTEYRYAVPEDEESKGICAIKIVLHSESGTSDSEAIGTGTGYQQTYQLKHSPSDATVKLFADDTEIQGTYIGNRLVQTAAAEGKALTAKYNWTSEPPVITQITAVFSE